MVHSWSCEHCGRPSTSGKRACDDCGDAMCWPCTLAHDESDACPGTGP